ncbi:MAG: hypothetical protein C4346_02400, partial [Chloroflexota bacterium]
ICPTLLDGRGPQEIVAQWDERCGAGFAVGIDRRGQLRLRAGDGTGRQCELTSGESLRAWCWYAVSASYN